MKLLTEIKIYESDDRQIFKVSIKHLGQKYEGKGLTPTNAYLWAENQFVIKPGLLVEPGLLVAVED